MEKLVKLTLLECETNVMYDMEVTPEIHARASMGKYINYMHHHKINKLIFIKFFVFYFADMVFATRLLRRCTNEGKQNKIKLFILTSLMK